MKSLLYKKKKKLSLGNVKKDIRRLWENKAKDSEKNISRLWKLVLFYF